MTDRSIYRSQADTRSTTSPLTPLPPSSPELSDMDLDQPSPLPPPRAGARTQTHSGSSQEAPVAIPPRRVLPPESEDEDENMAVKSERVSGSPAAAVTPPLPLSPAGVGPRCASSSPDIPLSTIKALAPKPKPHRPPPLIITTHANPDVHTAPLSALGRRPRSGSGGDERPLPKRRGSIHDMKTVSRAGEPSGRAASSGPSTAGLQTSGWNAAAYTPGPRTAGLGPRARYWLSPEDRQASNSDSGVSPFQVPTRPGASPVGEQREQLGTQVSWAAQRLAHQRTLPHAPDLIELFGRDRCTRCRYPWRCFVDAHPATRTEFGCKLCTAAGEVCSLAMPRLKAVVERGRVPPPLEPKEEGQAGPPGAIKSWWKGDKVLSRYQGGAPVNVDNPPGRAPGSAPPIKTEFGQASQPEQPVTSSREGYPPLRRRASATRVGTGSAAATASHANSPPWNWLQGGQVEHPWRMPVVSSDDEHQQPPRAATALTPLQMQFPAGRSVWAAHEDPHEGHALQELYGTEVPRNGTGPRPLASAVGAGYGSGQAGRPRGSATASTAGRFRNHAAAQHTLAQLYVLQQQRGQQQFQARQYAFAQQYAYDQQHQPQPSSATPAQHVQSSHMAGPSHQHARPPTPPAHTVVAPRPVKSDAPRFIALLDAAMTHDAPARRSTPPRAPPLQAGPERARTDTLPVARAPVYPSDFTRILQPEHEAQPTRPARTRTPSPWSPLPAYRAPPAWAGPSRVHRAQDLIPGELSQQQAGLRVPGLGRGPNGTPGVATAMGQLGMQGRGEDVGVRVEDHGMDEPRRIRPPGPPSLPQPPGGVRRARPASMHLLRVAPAPPGPATAPALGTRAARTADHVAIPLLASAQPYPRPRPSPQEVLRPPIPQGGLVYPPNAATMANLWEMRRMLARHVETGQVPHWAGAVHWLDAWLRGGAGIWPRGE